MSVSTITSKGQTTIPKEIREYLNLHPGDKIDFIIDESGQVIVETATLDIRELKGILHREDIKPVSVEDMKKSIKKHLGDSRG